MRRKYKGPLVLADLKRRTLSKVAEEKVIGKVALSPDAIYQISTAKADRGRNVEITDVRTWRMMADGSVDYYKNFSVPTEVAREIRVYKISD